MKFVCQRCCECCKGEEGSSTFGIRLFDFEAKNIEKKAKEKGIDTKIIPSFTISDKKSGKEFAVFYRFDSKDCPLFINNKCEIYSDRPLMCRTFPIITSVAKGSIVRSSACKGNLLVSGSDSATVQEVKECYGSCYEYCEMLEGLIKEVKEKLDKKIKNGVILPKKVKGKYPLCNISEEFDDIYEKDVLDRINKME